MMDYTIFQYLIMVSLAFAGGAFVAIVINYFSEQRDSKYILNSNLHNLPNELKSREQQIRHLADRIRTGQSSAVIGFFSEERRTILGYLRNEEPKQREMLYGDKADKLIFSYIDVGFLDKKCTLAQFWTLVLEQWKEKIPSDSELDKIYQTCQDNQFNKRSLENFISLVNQQGWRLVLLLDKFEVFLAHPHFQENWEFFTTLRVLSASRTPSPLALVIASNQSLKQFHERIQHLSPSTSPVLNFIEGGLTTLGGLSETEVDNLLDHNEPPLSQQTRQFLKEMVGGHPYLLNIAISEISSNGEPESFEKIEKAFYARIQNELENEIKLLSTSTCQAFFEVAQQGEIVGLEKELKELEMQGLVIKINEQWQIRPRIFFKLLTDKEKQKICHEQ